MVYPLPRRARILKVVALCVLTCLNGCGDGSSTAGKRIVLHTALSAEPATATTFSTGFGWDVTLTRAAVATQGLYYFDGPPPTALLEPRKRGMKRRIADWFVGTAWAHPGHYQAGTALGQVILPAPAALDLFAQPALALPDGDGVTGTYRSARFVLPQRAPSDPSLSGHIALAEGTAVLHDGSSPAPIHFRLVADYADVEMNINNGAVDGCVLDETDVTDSGTISVEIKPSVWLNLVDFSALSAGTEAAPSEAHDAGFSQGVTQLSAYHFRYSK